MSKNPTLFAIFFPNRLVAISGGQLSTGGHANPRSALDPAIRSYQGIKLPRLDLNERATESLREIRLAA